MKQFVCVMCAFCMIFSATAQLVKDNQLRISTGKTSSLIFPFAIKHVDRGTKDVLTQQVAEADNLLLVKASIPFFKETNLSVVTADGQLYSFTVIYDSMPRELVHRLIAIQPVKRISFPGEVMNNTDMDFLAEKVLGWRRTVRGVKKSKWDVSAMIKGIFIKDNVLFFSMDVENRSSIDYDVEMMRFFIRDIRKSKRTATQEVELKPLLTKGNISTVKAHQKNHLVFAFQKFTVPDAKSMVIQIMEQNGGRHLQFPIRNGKIIKAVSLKYEVPIASR